MIDFKEAYESLYHEVYEEGQFYYVEDEIETALKALAKQIPVKPYGRHTEYRCSICKRRVRSGKGSSSHVRDNFCQGCGQMLDWSDSK